MATHGSLRRACARFDSFRVDLSSNELFRSGTRVAIQEQPFQVLRLLIEADGQVVRRDQLRTALWPQDTFVDFEHGVNTAVKKVRQALADSSEHPKFVETLPKIGYRFIAPVEWAPESDGSSEQLNVLPIDPPGLDEVPALTPQTSPRFVRWRSGLISLTIALLLTVAIGVYLLRGSHRVAADTLTITPFTTFPGFEIAPSFSPDGNQILFSWFGYEKEFQFDLYIKQVGQERVVQLTHHPATFLAGAWAPDGRSIAFMRHADPEATGVYLISALGGAERKLANITSYKDWAPIAVSWSPDSKWVAFSKGNPPARNDAERSEHFSIHLVNVDTAEERTVPRPSTDCMNIWQPVFSPDGRQLASVCLLTEGVAKIYVQDLDGTQSREITDARSSQGFSGLAWARDGRSLLYSSDQHLWRVPLGGGKTETLLFAQDVETVAVSQTGNRLAYAQVRHPSSIWQLALAGPTAKEANVAAKLISSTRGDERPSVSPDGKYIAFQSWRSGSPEIWKCERDASNPVQLTSFGGPQIGTPSWSPDGRRIAFDVRASGNAELYVVNRDGGPPNRLSTGTENVSEPFWSSDGRTIYFSTEPPDAIWKVPVEGGTAIRLTKQGNRRSAPREAADGNGVLFDRIENGHAQMWSVSLDGGDERPVEGMPLDVQWVPARNGAYFIEGTSRRYFLRHFNFATRKVRTVADLPRLFVLWGLHLAPDGNTMLFSGIEHSDGDIMLVDGFR